ncbi:MAG: helix-turn-helix domain-containing protein [Muribaculaceae bacterium]
MYSSLYLLQFGCFLAAVVLALLPALSRVYAKWLNRRYEQSRWMIVAAMLILAVHYLLQMRYDLRARGEDVGAAVNVLFYSPAAILVWYSFFNMEYGERRGRRRYLVLSIACYALILGTFAIGWLSHHSLHIGEAVVVMYWLFLACILFFLFAPLRQIRTHRRRIEATTGGDMQPYVAYTRLGYIQLCVAALMAAAAIVSTRMLFYVAPLFFVSLLLFVFSFVALGYNIEPMADVEGETALGYIDAATDGYAADHATAITADRLDAIAAALERWCADRGYRDSTLTLGALAQALGVSRRDLSLYFDIRTQSTFRVWLSNVRLHQAQQLIIEHPDYSNEAVSIECGFSSRGQLYKIFHDKTGMSPGEWKKTLRPRP